MPSKCERYACSLQDNIRVWASVMQALIDCRANITILMNLCNIHSCVCNLFSLCLNSRALSGFYAWWCGGESDACACAVILKREMKLSF
jgi:hypothetical protein